MKKVILFVLGLSCATLYAQLPQISINRIEQMPDSPTPYLMRDWKMVAEGYDNFIYDLTKSGDYMPLIFILDEGINYPENTSFGIDSYVGTFSSGSGEAINVLPSLVGASLLGIDKSNQNGMNWVLMGQDFFNKRPEENVYLNNHSGNSGTDWWYDIMPNIYFYQLNDLYPGIGDSEFQFKSIADQWLEAVITMGGSGTPWTIPFMNYRAWSLSTMSPLIEGVKEPEAAGGIAWLLYHAYIQTGDANYLLGAEWSMEFLNSLTANPSYELQLPYGIYIAAKMNAQMGTSYDIEKMVNWTFDRGDLRGWGAIVGDWNGVGASGLIGEANDQGNDYAFLMNGFQHAGALVPMVRYDKQYARAIGKWMLNLSNATRLFYPGFLPDNQQDASEWSATYDPDGFIGYEALREKLNGNPGPYSTGDAVGGGWANTNLALYGSSSVGIFGGIIETTNVEKILKLDLLKTDYYREEAYPSFLYYNPYTGNQTITIDVGLLPVDLYDALSETFLAQNVSGNTNFTIPGNDAVVVVLTPPGGTISYDLNKMLIDEVIVDYMQTANVFNHPPRIKSLTASDELIIKGGSVSVYATTVDPEEEMLSYSWDVDGSMVAGTDSILVWTAPETTGIYQISVRVIDEQLNETRDSLFVEVVDHINSAPVILSMFSNKNNVNLEEEVEITCLAEDADGDPLVYSWSSNAGTISGTGNIINWQSPALEGIYSISVEVIDGNGGIIENTINLLIKDYTVIEKGKLIAYYPFSGNADDESGNNHNGQVFGATLSEDTQGNNVSAYHFDGVNDYIKVENDDKLNFTEALTVSCWIRAENLLSGTESFILSHGSWQNRYKLSINSAKLRWTLNTTAEIKDVDSGNELVENEDYHITATYDGKYAILYLNGKLDNYAVLNGSIKTSSFSLLMGRMLPDDDHNFNYSGLIDEVLIYDYAVTPEDAIFLLSDPLVTGVQNINEYEQVSIYPNPTTGSVFLEINDQAKSTNLINVYNLYGQKINISVTEITSYGKKYKIDFSHHPNGIYFVQIGSQNGSQVAKIVVSK